MSVYLVDESVLLDDAGSVATSEDCCCPGVCCDCDGNCDADTTKEDCEAANNQWLSDAACDDDPDPCESISKGACCDGSDCSIKTENCCTNDGGDYQGDDTSCDPNPCVETGACCIDGECSITTPEGCAGTYQGVGSVCDPNPCPEVGPCDCVLPFSAFDSSGRKFRTLTRTVTGAQSYSPSSADAWEINWNAVATYSACGGECLCDGTGTIHIASPGSPDLDCDIFTTGCGYDCPSGACAWPSGTTGCLWASSPAFCVGNYSISNMSACCTLAFPICCAEGGPISATVRIFTYGCGESESPCHTVNVTIEEVLSDECIPT